MGADAQGPSWTWQTGVTLQGNQMFANVLAFHVVFTNLIQWKPPYHLTMQIKINTKLPFAHRELNKIFKKSLRKAQKFPTQHKNQR